MVVEQMLVEFKIVSFWGVGQDELAETKTTLKGELAWRITLESLGWA
jgi:hypothetical protein